MAALDAATVSNFKEAAEIAWAARWQILWPMNAGEIISFSFAMHLIGWVFFAPGDFILLETILHATRSALFLNLSSKDLSGFLSGVFSLLSWSGILMLRLKYSGKSKYSIT